MPVQCNKPSAIGPVTNESSAIDPGKRGRRCRGSSAAPSSSAISGGCWSSTSSHHAERNSPLRIIAGLLIRFLEHRPPLGRRCRGGLAVQDPAPTSPSRPPDRRPWSMLRVLGVVDVAVVSAFAGARSAGAVSAGLAVTDVVSTWSVESPAAARSPHCRSRLPGPSVACAAAARAEYHYAAAAVPRR